MPARRIRDNGDPERESPMVIETVNLDARKCPNVAPNDARYVLLRIHADDVYLRLPRFARVERPGLRLIKRSVTIARRLIAIESQGISREEKRDRGRNRALSERSHLPVRAWFALPRAEKVPPHL